VKNGIAHARLSRRALLRWSTGAAALLALPRSAGAASGLEPERSLAFVHTHTGERGRVTYWATGEYVREGLAEIDHLLRDHYSGAVHRIDVRLLDLLHELQVELGAREPFHVISGYRSPETNAALAAHRAGVASKSLHMAGEAIDVRIPGCQLVTLRDAALALRGGGVGFYPGSDFVHVDVGRVRRW
jgi:uncharacterized protein YcbK (DUF882 family)